MTVTPSATPTLRGRLSRLRPWLLLAAGAVVVALISVLAAGGLMGTSAPYLDTASPRPNGAKALIEVLGDNGVSATSVGTLEEARESLAAAGDSTTLVIHDRDALATDELAQRIGELSAERIVLLEPGSSLLAAFGDRIVQGGVSAASEAGDTVAVGEACAESLTRSAPEISARGGRLYAAAAGVTGSSCYPQGDRHALVEAELADGATVTALGATDNLTNGEILSAANAALGMHVLGQTEALIWYVPGLADHEAVFGTEPSISDFAPPWLTPTILVAFAGILAAMVWRGRRFGPLVEERLPVVVAAAETMEGRGRLYAKHRTRLRALDNLRIGTTGRLATRLGLSSLTGVQDVITSSAAILGADRRAVAWTLLDAEPQSEQELLELGQALSTLEQDVAAATNPNHPDSPGGRG